MKNLSCRTFASIGLFTVALAATTTLGGEKGGNAGDDLFSATILQADYKFREECPTRPTPKACNAIREANKSGGRTLVDGFVFIPSTEHQLYFENCCPR